ncbi:MAG: hypothetical protein JXA33_14045 [Anaerolineae bacterium]|nr:hypothetical protein [Anaerolineae bacterium]
MSSEEEDITHFLTHWFSGLMKGLENIQAPSRTTILRECGQACARSYTAQVFHECWQQADGEMTRFLMELAARFPEAEYTQLDTHTLQVHYRTCACDLVRRGWVTSPTLCECSLHNLQANFEQALGKPVTVTLKTSLLRGETACVFEVSLNEVNNHALPTIS